MDIQTLLRIAGFAILISVFPLAQGSTPTPPDAKHQDSSALSPITADTSTPTLARSSNRPARLQDFPLLFIPNRGQWETPASYVARTPEADIAFTATEATLYFHDAAATDNGHGSAASIVRMRPLNAPAAIELTPGAEGQTRTSYFSGSDPARWRTDVPTYGQLRYPGVQPGIDLVFRGDGQRLVYDLEVAPGADPESVRLELDGVRRLTLDDTGSLVMELPDGRALRQQAPFIYQEIAGERVRIDGGFVIRESDSDRHRHVFGFKLGAYDPTLALVIDPTLIFSTFVGGTLADEVRAMAMTATGEAVIVGSTLSTTFAGKTEFGTRAKRDGLIYRVNAAGALDYVITLGGTLDDQINGIALSGNTLYLTGETLSNDLPVVNALYRILPGGKAKAAFVAKINATGGSAALDFLTYFGGTGVDSGIGIGIDSSYLYVAGDTASLDLPIRNALYPTRPGSVDLFLLKLSQDGKILHSSTYFGGAGTDNLKAMQVTPAGDIYLAGITTSTGAAGAATNIPIKGAFQATNAGGTDSFLTRIVPGGEELVFSTYLGGKNNDFLTDMKLDQDGHLLLSGYTNSTSATFPTQNPLYPELTGTSNDGFIAKLDKYGRFLHFSTYLGGLGDDRANAIAIDQADNSIDGRRYIHVAGETQSNNFPIENAIQSYYGGSRDAFIAKLDRNAQRLVYSSFFGGLASDTILAMGATPNPLLPIFIAGNTTSTGTSMFPVRNPAQATPGGATDNFVAGIDPNDIWNTLPALELRYANALIEEIDPEADVWLMGDSLVDIDLILTNPPGTGVDVAAFSTRINYDQAKLEYVGHVWDPEAMPGYPANPGEEIKFPALGTIDLTLFQNENTPLAIPNGVRLIRITFRILGVGSIADDPPKPSQLLILKQADTTAINPAKEVVAIDGLSGGILLRRPCNALLGDCDCSGMVKLAEVQKAASAYFTTPPSERCMKLDRDTNQQVDIPDIMQIVLNHIDRIAKTSLPASLIASQYQEVDPLPSQLSLLALPTGATLDFGPPSVAGNTISADLTLHAAGNQISAIGTDILYDPTAFSGIQIVEGQAVRDAGKSLSFAIVKPGTLRILVYGLNTTSLRDGGTIGTLRLTPTVDLSQIGKRIEQPKTSASTPNAKSVVIQGGSLLLGNATNIESSDLNQFIAQQYLDFLNRAGEPSGIEYWLTLLGERKITRSQLILSFFDSKEFQENIAPLARLYFAYFKRIPDYPGLMYWISEFKAGKTLSDVSQAFASSPEFTKMYGSLNNSAFVDLVYQNVLGRTPDANGRNFWIQKLNTGTTRGEMMIGFSESAEYRNSSHPWIQVTMMYMSMLRRAPEQSGFDYWVGQLGAGRSILDLVSSFSVSKEYIARF